MALGWAGDEVSHSQMLLKSPELSKKIVRFLQTNDPFEALRCHCLVLEGKEDVCAWGAVREQGAVLGERVQEHIWNEK